MYNIYGWSSADVVLLYVIPMIAFIVVMLLALHFMKRYTR